MMRNIEWYEMFPFEYLNRTSRKSFYKMIVQSIRISKLRLDDFSGGIKQLTKYRSAWLNNTCQMRVIYKK